MLPGDEEQAPPPAQAETKEAPSSSSSSSGISNEQAAQVIQSAWRAWIARHAFLRERTATQAQDLARAWLARKAYAVEYNNNRWRLEASKNATARLVSPVKNRASVRLSRKLPTRGHRPTSLPQALSDPIPTFEISESGDGEQSPTVTAEDEEKKAVRKPIPGMMGIGAFNPSLVKLKSAPRLSLNLTESSSTASNNNSGDAQPSFDLKRLKSAPRPVSESMLPVDPSKLSQSPPPSRANLKPAASSFNSEKTQSLPDMPVLPKLKPTPKSPLSSSPPISHAPPKPSKLHTATAAQDLPPPPPPVINELPPPPVDLPPPILPPHSSSSSSGSSTHLGIPDTASPKQASPAVPKKPGPKMVLPPEWECHVDVQGRKYYYNTETEVTVWKCPPLVPESSLPKKMAPKPVAQQPSQQNLFGHLEMLIPQHKFAPQVPKKPPPPPVGTPPPEPRSSHSPSSSPSVPRPSPSPSPAPSSSSSSSSSSSVGHAPAGGSLPPPILPPSSLPPPIISPAAPLSSSSSSSNIPASNNTSSSSISSSQPQPQQQQPQTQPSQQQIQHQESHLDRQSSSEKKDKRSALRKWLDAFLGRRPSKQDLIQKNILPKDEAGGKPDDGKKKKKEDKKKGKK